MAKQIATTQRAYTLRLRGANPEDQSWRDALWQTHEAVNKGAKAFGDWLLTLQGGVDHAMADAKVKGGKKKPDRDPTEEERKARRILLALSWLSVESQKGAPGAYIVPHDLDQQSGTRSNWKTVDALKEILKKRGLGNAEIQEWTTACKASLEARIRDDAVWVNRSKAFDEARDDQDEQQAREDARTLLLYLLTDDYLELPKAEERKQSKTADQEEEKEASDEKTEDKSVKSGKRAGQRTRHLFSHIFGRESTKGFGKPVRKLKLRKNWLECLKPAVEAAGIPLSDPNAKTRKGAPPSPSELHREMFSKAASRLAQIWTKQKQQEVERQARTVADEKLRKLENDQVSRNALDLLDAYCRERGQATGSLEEYRINPRALEGWDRVVAAWGKIKNPDPAKAAEKRIDKAKLLQDEDPDKKFGDINLFVSLAEPEYEPVWRQNGQATSSILEIYVKGWKARTDAVRLKVAAFRHPDPYFHPVFCQFGVSRPSIKYSRLDTNHQGDSRIVQMRLLSEGVARDIPLLASSKRLDVEIGSTAESTVDSVPEVARRSRHGIAAVTEQGGGNLFRVAHVFDQQEVWSREEANEDSAQDETDNDESLSEKKKKGPAWNGTLQADRRELEVIGRLESVDPRKANAAKQHLRWWLIASLELQCTGPWYEYIANLADQSPFFRTVREDEQEKRKKRKMGTKYVSWLGWPHDENNKPLKMNTKGTALVVDPDSERKGHAKLILSRLPGLRVLSVDLGHRYAAACTVWETLSAEQLKTACTAVGHEPPRDSDFFLHLKNGKQTIVYRRIGADTIAAGDEGKVKTVAHPAPWARLERQFLIKLQGEDREARKASCAEVKAVQKLDQAVEREPLDRCVRVGDLMSEAVRTMRLALQRHGRRARIAFNLTASKKLLPGGREEAMTDEGRVALLADTLADWYALFTGKGWGDEWAEQQWKNHVGEAVLPQAPEDAEATSKARKKYRVDLIEKLKPFAEGLAKNDSLCRKLHCLWGTRWREDDVALQKHIRWLRDWILPRGKAKDSRAIRNVGGLSLTRITTIKSLYQVQKAFHMRPEPEDLRKNIPSKGDDALRDFGRSILDVMEQMREQRVKQLASRIAEAALGIGRMKRFAGGKDLKRPRERVDQPCHAVVIENLTHYRPEETRTRRENRQLMSWSSSKVKKYLAEACQLHGLHLREVQAGYTSRQDSRTGAPGARCQDVPVKEFMQSPFWRKQVAQAEGKGDARNRFLCDLNTRPETDWKKAGTVRIPLKGGEIFVSANAKSTLAKGLQADLNAAANIGLKALVDPDWPGKWWYVPCDSMTFKPAKDKTAGSAAICLDKPLKNATATQDTDGPKKKRGKARKRSGEYVNLWRDVSSQPISANSGWREFTPYWDDVQDRVVNILRQAAGLTQDQGER